MSGKLYIKTHGCQMNEYDSDKMADVLAQSHGLQVTDNEAEADVILAVSRIPVNVSSMPDMRRCNILTLVPKASASDPIVGTVLCTMPSITWRIAI